MDNNLSLTKICLALLLLISFSFDARSQERKWPIRYRKRIDANAPIREGYIILKNADTVKGFIKLLPITNAYPVLDTGTNAIRAVNISGIASMKLYTANRGGPFSDYFDLSYKHTLWRLLARKNNVSLYDDPLRVGGAPHVILVTPDKRIKLFSGMTWFLHNGNMYNDELLIRFINKRYKTSWKEEDFRSTEDIYTYIVNKER